MKIPLFHSTKYYADIGQHVMPIRKFNLVRDAIEAEGLPVTIQAPTPVTDEQLLRVHTPEYVEAIRTGEPVVLAQSQKFPWSAGLAEAVRWTNGGCIDALRAALDTGVAANLASGFHHSHARRGEGYCTFNGLIVAAEQLKSEGRLKRILVVDMDLHYGNGTAFLLANRPDFYQLSIYGNWYDENLAHRDVMARRTPDTENAWSVPVPNGSGRDVYLGILQETLPAAIERSRPDAILYQAGADPYKEDPYSPLDLDHDALKARDTMVFEAAKARGIPIMWVLAGGYTPDVGKVVEVHVNTCRAACAVF